MESALRISVHFLQPYSHGRGEDGLPEWPPSPLRLFQALVASSLGRQVDPERLTRATDALRWLERQPPPEIIAPPASFDPVPYRLYVPDNTGDRVAKSWSAGRGASLADYRTEKDVRSARLSGETVHYLFRGAVGVEAHFVALRAAARSMTHLGWGIDLVAGDATSGISEVVGERWVPGRLGGNSLRCPIAGTLDALEHRHTQFLARLDGGLFRPVSPLTRFAQEVYARATDPDPRPFVALRLLEPITGDRISLDSATRARDVSAWTRHAVGEVAEGWPFGPTRGLVHGHVDGVPGPEPVPRLSYLPLPTINPKLDRVEGIGRVLVTGPAQLAEPLAWLRARLPGRELMWNEDAVAVLEPLPASDWVAQRYVTTSDRWSTVTPVVLPGHDDRSPRKAERLLRKAFVQAGLDPDVLDDIVELEWRKVGFRPGTEHASRYLRPDRLTGALFHVRVTFSRAVSGPLFVGTGRHRGLGVFAADPHSRRAHEQ